jgi:hypothetical protein
MDKFFEGRYNQYLDSGALRVMLIATGFSVWLAAGVSLLKFGL